MAVWVWAVRRRVGVGHGAWRMAHGAEWGVIPAATVTVTAPSAMHRVTKGLPVCVTGARGSPRLSRVDGELIAISYLTKMA